jgi:hypothetical protein
MLFINNKVEYKSYAITIIKNPPNKNMKKKSAVLPLKDPSSRYRQYLYVNRILNKKLKPIGPK